MRELRVALAQINPTVGDVEGNARRVREWLARAERAGADVAFFPELCLTGYPPEDLVLRPSFVEANVAALGRLAADVGSTAAVVGYADRQEGAVSNAAALLWRGRVRGVYRKVCLPNYGVFDEVRTFRPGDRYPVFVLRGVRIGVSICEDAWVGDGPVAALARNGAEVIANLNASPYHMNKGFERQVLFRQRALDARAHFLYVQTVGGQDELVFDGDSLAYDPAGRLLARGAQFAEDLVVLDLSLPDRPRRMRARAEVVTLSGKPARPPRRPPLPPRRRRAAMGVHEEIYTALVLGTRDYVRKNGFESVVIGLSGGIDSSLTAVIATDAVGAENVTGVAMPSGFSSTESLEDAKELAANLGIGFRILPIAAPFEAMLAALAEPFEGIERGLAEENLQARIRGDILMALSNTFGSLVLTTGNKSELATGYSTLYGDMAGGFAVLKDVPKTLVYDVASWRNANGIAVIPSRVFTKPPSAELRPGQLDTDSLPPYERLDPILAAYVEESRGIDDIVRAGFDAATVRRVAALVDRSEYKRRQAPPGIKITPLAFGKDRRLPITNAFKPWERERAPAPGRRKR